MLLFTTVTLMAQEFEANGIEFEVINPNEVKVIGHDFSKSEVYIPKVAVCAGKTYNVTEIGKTAFFSYKKLTAITIPQGIISIGKQAFDGCIGLISVTLPEGLDSIADNAFANCTNLVAVILPHSLKSIGNSAFNRCSNLTQIVFPSGLRSIGYSAFYGCTGLSSVIIPEGITKIELASFKKCTGLVSVTFSGSLTEIDPEAFEGCSKLTVSALPSGVTIGRDAFKDCANAAEIEQMMRDRTVVVNNIRYEVYDDRARVVETPGSKYSGRIIIPETINAKGKTYRVTEIGRSAFSSCYQMTEITLPSGITHINDYAFSRCKALKEIIFPSGLVSIGVHSFSDCDGLKLNFPAHIHSINDYAFDGCKSLTISNLPECAVAAYDRIFQRCTIEEIVGYPESLVQKTNQIWAETQKKDKIADYQSFINMYPILSELMVKARERIVWQETNRAIVKADYPQSVKKQNGRYSWTTIFRETGGKAGFVLKSYDFYVGDSSGQKWNKSGFASGDYSQTVTVKKNGRYDYPYWCSDGNIGSKFTYYHIIWIGEDDWGNRIEIEQYISLE